MANRVEGVTEKLLQCAKQEFLEKGFTKASLRSIAKKAGSSKGAIYIRFADKESLFSALVKPQADGIKNRLQSTLYEYSKLPGDTAYEWETMEAYSDKKMTEIIEYIYDYFDIFKILATGSEGTAYSNFIHDLVEIEMEFTVKFLESKDSDFFSSGHCSKELLHIVTSAYFSGFFEIFVHDMTKENAIRYIEKLTRFYKAGWKTIF